MRLLAISSVPTSYLNSFTRGATAGDIQYADVLSQLLFWGCDFWRYPVCRLPLSSILTGMRLLAISSMPTSSLNYLTRDATAGDNQYADFLSQLLYWGCDC